MNSVCESQNLLGGRNWGAAEGNCVATMRGGEQPEAEGWSQTEVNSIRRTNWASLLAKGKACCECGEPATRRLRGLVPEARVLVLTTFEDDDEVLAAIEAGAAGYMLKASPAEKLVEAICTVMRGGSPLEPSVASKVMAELARLSRRQSEERCQRLADPLSARELEVLRALCEGLSNKEIAGKLGLTEGTVKNHMTQVLSKLGVLDRTQAALRAHALGLLKPGE